MVLARTFIQLPLLLDLFNHLAAGAGPRLNFSKCVIILLWTLALQEASQMIRGVIPRTEDFIIKLATKLLGVVIGPLAHLSAWHGLFVKYSERLHRVKAFGLGFANSVSLRNIHIFSVLSHTMQFHSGNLMTSRLEREGHQRLLSAPRYTYNGFPGAGQNLLSTACLTHPAGPGSGGAVSL